MSRHSSSSASSASVSICSITLSSSAPSRVSMSVAPTRSPSVVVTGKTGLPVTAPAYSTMSVSRYSATAGSYPASMIFRAALTQLSLSRNGRSKMAS